MTNVERVTAVAIEIVDDILADIKRRGKGRDFYTKEKIETMRQELITKVVRTLMKERWQ